MKKFLLFFICLISIPSIGQINEDLTPEERAYLFHVVKKSPILNNNCGAISNGTITVPCSFYKIVYKDTGADKIAVAFILNNQGSTANLKTFVCNIDQIETLTGIDFFSALPDDVENKLVFPVIGNLKAVVFDQTVFGQQHLL